MPVGGGQLADVLRPVAHDARQVAGVAQAPHGDAVQVHGLDEVAEEGTLQPQHVPPAGRWASAGHGTHLATAPAAWAPARPCLWGRPSLPCRRRSRWPWLVAPDDPSSLTAVGRV